MPADDLETLHAFRSTLHRCLRRRADALFELVDALLTAEAVTSLPHLSVLGAHRRGWGSRYDALAAGRCDVAAVQVLLTQHTTADEQPVYAIDLSGWPRCDAEASPDRGFYDHPSRHSAGQPIVAGWAYQWLAQLSFARDSGTAPLDGRRVHPAENATTVAIEQITGLVSRSPGDGATPLFVFAAGYDSAQLTQGLAPCPVAILVRLRGDRCFYADPPPAEPSPKRGRPRQHGAKFACKDPTTWPSPTSEPVTQDEQYGSVHVRAWSGLHPKQQAHPGRGTRKTRPMVRGRSSRSRSAACQPGHTRRRRCGCGGTVRTRPWTSTSSGARTSDALIWNTPSGSASSASAGRCRESVTRSKPTAGRGWSWRPPPNCGWPDRGWLTGAYPGSDRWTWGRSPHPAFVVPFPHCC